MPPRTDRTGPDPADMEAVAGDRLARIEADMAAAHDINANVHVGHYPQRPDYSFNQTTTAGSYEQLAASLPDAPGNKIEQDEQGNWVRYVPVVVGQVRDDKGVVYNEVEDTPRYVSLSQEGARGASAEGRETDWWNGATWFRRGYKPERDILLAPAPVRERRLERADAATQALMERDDLKRAAAAPLVPRADSSAFAAGGGKKE